MKVISRLNGSRGIRHIALLTSLLFGSQLAMALNNPEKASAYYEEALSLYSNSQYDEAVIQLKNAFQENSRLLPALLLLGEAYLQTGNPAAAETALNDALELGADLSLVIIPLSKAHLMQFKHDDLLTQVVPETLPATVGAELHLLRAHAALEINEQRAANDSLAAAERLTPLAAEVLALKAALLMRSGQLEKAGELITRLKDLYPKNSIPWLTDASLKHVKGELTAALESYSKVLELDPKNNNARIARIGLMMDLNRDNENTADFEALGQSIPSDPRVIYLRAVSFARAGDQHGSTAALNDTLNILDLLGPEIVTRNLQLLMIAAIANYSLNNLESARDYLETYIKSSPKELAPKRVLATVYMRQGEYTNAANLLKNMLEESPNDPDLLAMLAQAYDSAGNHQQSVMAFENALNQTDNDPKLKTQLAISKMNAGFLEQGLDELNNLFFSEQPQASTGFALAVTLLNREKFTQAAKVSRELVVQDPENLAKQNLLAIALVGTGELTEAEILFTSILQSDPNNYSVKRNLAKIKRREGDYEAAKLLLNELIAINEKDPDLMLEMAQISMSQDNITEALRWAKDAADTAPQSFSVNSYLIDLLTRNGNLEEALKISLDQASIHNDNLHVLESQVRVLQAAKNKDQLLSLLRQMATLADFNTQWLLKIARYQITADSLDEASYTLFRGLQGNPEHFETRTLLADIEIRLGRLDQAMERGKQLISDHPEANEGYRLVGDVRMEHQQFESAITSYSEALKRTSNASLVLRLHIAQRYNNQQDKAKITLQNWLIQHPEDRLIKNTLGEFYLSTNSYAEAAHIYQELLETEADAPHLNNNLAYSLFKLGKTEQAISYARRAYALTPTDPMVNDTLGWLLVNNSNQAEGLPFLREALTRASSNVEIRYHLAVALYKLNRLDEARRELIIALEPQIKFSDYPEAIRLLDELNKKP